MMNEGWVCPKCGRVLAPNIMYCLWCCSGRGSTTTSTADRKTGNCSEKPNNCETCKWGEWYRNGYDITMMDEECGGCCSWNSKWTPKTEPTGYNLSPVEDELQKEIEIIACPIIDDDAWIYEAEPQTERSE